jgi:hypothetical protein
MVKKQNDEPEETTDEETEPLAGEEELEDSAGIPGQIMYPEVEVDAERAGEYAAGKVDTLDPDAEERTERERIQDDIDTYPRDEEEVREEEDE